MPANLIFHIRYALTLGGRCNNRNGLINSFSLRECGLNLIKIIAVDADNVPTKGLELFINRLCRVYLVNRAVDLQAVKSTNAVRLERFL